MCNGTTPLHTGTPGVVRIFLAENPSIHIQSQTIFDDEIFIACMAGSRSAVFRIDPRAAVRRDGRTSIGWRRFRPSGRGFSRHEGLPIRCNLWGSVEMEAHAPIIVSMSPPGYPSAWLPPGRARFRFAWQSYCSFKSGLCGRRIWHEQFSDNRTYHRMVAKAPIPEHSARQS